MKPFLLAIAFVLVTGAYVAAQDCPCGPDCNCTADANCGNAGCAAVQSTHSDAIKPRKFVPLAYLQQTRFAGKVRYRHGKREDRRCNRKSCRGC